MNQSSLPDFARPPVIEVALSVQFEDPLDLGGSDIVSLAEAWPELEPELRPVLPEMDLNPSHHEMPNDDADDLRLWLSGESGSRVVQVQHDRLAVNWARSDPSEEYPRFGTLRDSFIDAWHRLDAATGGELLADICQVLYVNHIGAESGWESVEHTSKILCPWSGTMSDEFLPEPEIAANYLHFHMPDPGQWLDIETGPVRVDDEPKLAMYLAARGMTERYDLDSALDLLDLAHEWIVQGFVSITTPEAHKIWGKK